MARQTAYLHAPDVLFLPWVESANDRRFKRILLIVLVVTGLLGAIVPFLPTPEIVKSELEKVSPRITKLILEKQKLPPPPVPEKKEVKKVPIEKAVKKPVKKSVEEKTPAKEKTQSKAFEKAAKSGLVALSSELEELRQGFDLPAFDDKPLKKSSEIKQANIDTNVLTAKAKRSSDGIDTSKLATTTGAAGVSQRTTTRVSSSLNKSVAADSSSSSNSSRGGQRDKREIEKVFQKNKGAIYSIYNRALRKDPTLEGKVVVELTISPQGSVTACRIVSSDLNDEKLERKIVSRIKLFKFKSANVAAATVSYPIDFFPS